jgi:hypothetical protein
MKPPTTLRARIDAGLRERLEEAIDDACLDALVRARRASDRPAPAVDSIADRADFDAAVQAFLERLRVGVPGPAAGDHARRPADPQGTTDRRDRETLLAIQIELARSLPDYWQRFERVRSAFAEEAAVFWGGQRSGRERPGFLRRLLGG